MSQQISNQKGKIFLITGSNAGVGFVTAKLLAEQEAGIIMACRNPRKGGQALARLQTEVPDAKFSLVRLDFALVHECASEVTEKCLRSMC